MIWWLSSSATSARSAAGIIDIAEISGIPTSSYACLERGRYRLTAESLLRIQIALGCSIETLWPFGNWRVAQGHRRGDPAHSRRDREKAARTRYPFDIVEAIYHTTGVDFDEMASRTIRRPVAEARAVAAYLARHTPGVLMNDLARALDMDVSSISTAATRMEQKAARNEDYEGMLKEAVKWLRRVVREESERKYDAYPLVLRGQIRP